MMTKEPLLWKKIMMYQNMIKTNPFYVLSVVHKDTKLLPSYFTKSHSLCKPFTVKNASNLSINFCTYPYKVSRETSWCNLTSL